MNNDINEELIKLIEIRNEKRLLRNKINNDIKKIDKEIELIIKGNKQD